MPPNSQTVASISQETGISALTLYAWKKQFRAKGFVVPQKPNIPDRWDAKTKLAAVIQTAAMNETERSAYCRERGLYPEQIDAWKAAFEAVANLVLSLTVHQEGHVNRSVMRFSNS